LEVPGEANAAEIPLEAEIESKTKLTRVSMFADGDEVHGVDLPEAPFAKDIWKVVASVPVNVDGTRTTHVDFRVWNLDGEAGRQSETKYVSPEKPSPLKPRISLERFHPTVTRQLEIECLVRSKLPLTRVVTRITARGRTIQEPPVSLEGH